MYNLIPGKLYWIITTSGNSELPTSLYPPIDFSSSTTMNDLRKSREVIPVGEVVMYLSKTSQGNFNVLWRGKAGVVSDTSGGCWTVFDEVDYDMFEKLKKENNLG